MLRSRREESNRAVCKQQTICGWSASLRLECKFAVGMQSDARRCQGDIEPSEPTHLPIWDQAETGSSRDGIKPRRDQAETGSS